MNAEAAVVGVRGWWLMALALAAAALTFTLPARAQFTPDSQAMIRDTQQMSRSAGELTLVWWLPEQYWRASMANDKAVNPAQAEEILRIIRPYTIIAVVDGSMGAMGGVTYRSEGYLRGNMSIKDAQGHIYAPLGDDQITPDARNLLQVLKPIIANILGPLGQNMYFLVFPAQDASGSFFADPAHKGLLAVDIATKQFQYRLPLGSFLPPMYDPATGERFPGNYLYSPFSGKALTLTPPPKVSGAGS